MIRRTYPARSVPTYAYEESRPPSPKPTTKRTTANAADHAGRPVDFDAADYKNRNVIGRRFGHMKQWCGLATRHKMHAVIYRAGVLIQGVIAWTKQCWTHSS